MFGLSSEDWNLIVGISGVSAGQMNSRERGDWEQFIRKIRASIIDDSTRAINQANCRIEELEGEVDELKSELASLR